VADFSCRRLHGDEVSLVDLILMAYGIERFQLVGGPPWMRSDRFDIVARATGNLTSVSRVSAP
jgi:uncharacterized protein (TIGR03435 family)